MAAFDDVPRSTRIDLVGRRVFLRADLDVPVSAQGAVLDDTRLRELLPTLRTLRAEGAKVVVAGAFGTAAAPSPEGAQRGIADRLGELLGLRVGALSKDFLGELRFLKDGEVSLLPNLARIPEEEQDDGAWAANVAQGFDVYVNDAVRASTRATASVDALPRLLPARAAGPQLTHELDVHRNYAEAISTPFTAVVGGESVVAREALLRFATDHANALLLGGVVASTFMAAAGLDVGASTIDRAGLSVALDILDRARARGVDLRIPVDAVVATRLAPGAPAAYSVRKRDQIGPNDAIIDIAVETCLAYRAVLIRSATVLFNGVMGTCTDDESQSGTIRVAQAATEAARYSLLVGDHTVATARVLRLDSLFRDVATGGEASLALLRGAVLPGVESLRTRGATP